MKRLFVLLIVFALFLSINVKPISAKANSAQTKWEGSSSAGVVVTGEDCPLEVEKEVLTFDLNSLPVVWSDNKDYNASVSAEYSFYNPTDLDLSIDLAFPLGDNPSYVDGYAKKVLESDLYNVQIDGEKVSTKIRYTVMSGAEFGESDIEKIKTLTNSEVVIDKQSVAYSYYFDVEDDNYQIFVEGNPNNIVLSDCPVTRQENGDVTELFVNARAGGFKVVVIGEKPDSVYIRNDKLKIYPSPGLEPKVSLFYDMLGLYYGYSEDLTQEWRFDAVVDAITVDINSYGVSNYRIGRDFGSFMLWYEYSMQVGANQRVVNKVTAPICPAIDSYWNPPKYAYTYFLSPAKCWQSFGELEIIINTPFKMIESGDFDFEKVDGGYKLALEGLPTSELTFTLCESETPQGKKRSGCYLNVETDLGVIFIVMMG